MVCFIGTTAPTRLAWIANAILLVVSLAMSVSVYAQTPSPAEAELDPLLPRGAGGGTAVEPLTAADTALVGGDGSHGSPVPASTTQNLPNDRTASRVIGELACICGRCDREPLATCSCDFAVEMRGQIIEALEQHDLDSEEARDAAYQELRSQMLADHGPEILLSHDSKEDHGAVLELMPIAVFVAVVLVAIFTVRRARRGKLP